MNEERKMILEMVKNGIVSVEEAERLMEAVPDDKITIETDSTLTAMTGAPGFSPKRIVVIMREGDRTKVNVRVPFSLVRAGLKLGRAASALGLKHSKDADEAVVLEILKNLDIDEILAGIADGDITLPYQIVDMDEGDQHIEVVLE